MIAKFFGWCPKNYSKSVSVLVRLLDTMFGNATKTQKLLSRLMEAARVDSPSRLAECLDVSVQAVYDAKRRDKVPDAWVRIIAERFAVSSNWLFFGPEGLETAKPASVMEPKELKATSPVEVPVIGLAACGSSGWFSPSLLALRTPYPFGAAPVGAFAVAAVGANMGPEGIHQGFVLYCNPLLSPNRGDVIFVEKLDGTASVKRYAGDDGKELYLEGWLDPDEKGVQKPYQEKISSDTIKQIAVVTIVKRRA